MPPRLVVLISGSGTLLQALLDAERSGELDVQTVAVVSDRPDATGLARAERAGVATRALPVGPDRDRWDAELTRTVGEFSPDLVVSAGFMRLLGPAFLARFGETTINSHPSLLPSFPGTRAVADALAHGVRVTGCTIFAVDEGVDTGRIIAQEPVRVLEGDTAETLHERIKVVERRLLVEVVRDITGGRR